MEEPEQSPINCNCTEGDQLYQYELKFNYSEGDSGSYWYYIVIGGDTTFDFSEAWELRSTNLMFLWSRFITD